MPSETEIKIPDGYKADAKGRLVPVGAIKDEALLEDQTVEKILAYAQELSGQIARFKGHTFDDVGAFLDTLNEQYGAKKGGAKGNVSLMTFDGCAKVQVAVQDHIDFGAELQVAKSLIDECLEDWAEGSRDEIRAIVNHAFNVNQPDQVNREALFSLRKIDSEDPRWIKAVQAINDSIRTVGSKQYVRIYRRTTPQDKWQMVSIDLASA